MNDHSLRPRLAGVIALFACVAALPAAAHDEAVADTPVKKGPGVVSSSCAKPLYPREALRAEQQGTVTLKFLIGADGTVLKSDVHKSSGFPVLDAAAQTSLEKCSFTPGTLNGTPVEANYQMQYVWKLNTTGPKVKARQGGDAAAVK